MCDGGFSHNLHTLNFNILRKHARHELFDTSRTNAEGLHFGRPHHPKSLQAPAITSTAAYGTSGCNLWTFNKSKLPRGKPERYDVKNQRPAHEKQRLRSRAPHRAFPLFFYSLRSCVPHVALTSASYTTNSENSAHKVWSEARQPSYGNKQTATSGKVKTSCWREGQVKTEKHRARGKCVCRCRTKPNKA